MKTKRFLSLAATLGLAITFTLSCSGGDTSDNGGVVRGSPVTHGGETYQTVIIGAQTWIAKNLNYNAPGSKCYGEGGQVSVDGKIYTTLSDTEIQANCGKYGRLYNWEAAEAVCPVGWHLPSDEDWTTLENFVGSNAGTKLKATSGWDGNGNGTDDYGFSALPGGNGDSEGIFRGIGGGGWFATATKANADLVYIRRIRYRDSDVYKFGGDMTNLVSVRCVQN
jgi:uncharacterized protein (TIGR02145 family)